MARFERGGRDRRQSEDESGDVRIEVRLMGKGGKAVPSNISRACRVNGAKVSDVYDAIIAHLFGGEDE